MRRAAMVSRTSDVRWAGYLGWFPLGLYLIPSAQTKG